MVAGLDTSAEVWVTLLNHFGEDRKRENFAYSNNCKMLQKGNATTFDNLQNFKRICDDLSAIGKPVDAHRKVFELLKRLGPGYDSFCTTMLKPPGLHLLTQN